MQKGNVLGFEFLSFEEFSGFIEGQGGRVEIPECIRRLKLDPKTEKLLTPHQHRVLELRPRRSFTKRHSRVFGCITRGGTAYLGKCQ